MGEPGFGSGWGRGRGDLGGGVHEFPVPHCPSLSHGIGRPQQYRKGSGTDREQGGVLGVAGWSGRLSGGKTGQSCRAGETQAQKGSICTAPGAYS